MLNFFEEHNKLSWFITLVGGIGIFVLSSLTFAGNGGTSLLPILYHIIAFFFFALFLLIALVRGENKYFIFLIGIVIAIGYGVSDEIHQFFVPGRTSGFFDVFLNTVGILFASMVYLIRIRLKNSPQKSPLSKVRSRFLNPI